MILTLLVLVHIGGAPLPYRHVRQSRRDDVVRRYCGAWFKEG